MVVHENFVYLHLQKTGGCFVREFMTKAFPGCSDRTDLRHVPPKKMSDGEFVFSSIRNPWDWYVSWYSYRSDPFERLFGKHPNFKSLMWDLFSIKNGTLHDIDFRVMHQQGVGLLTYYYKRLFKHVKPEFFCRTENLRENLVQCFETIGLPLDEQQKELLFSMEAVNASEHQHYRDYYDDKLVELVREKDRFIIDKFGYEF